MKPVQRSIICRYLFALILTLKIVRRPWWDKNEPFCNISLARAWDIATDIWIKGWSEA